MKCENCPYPSSSVCRGKGVETCTVSREELQEQIKKVLIKLYEKDSYLIMNRVNEVCIEAHFGRYFFDAFQQRYEGHDMDTEYNRSGDWAKYYEISEDEKKKYAKPDMIIHKRGCNKHNFVCIEFKGWWNLSEEGAKNDEKKLIAFTRNEVWLLGEDRKYCYKYKYGIRLNLGISLVEFKWFINGEYRGEYDYIWQCRV